jgi:hypothetical protein
VVGTERFEIWPSHWPVERVAHAERRTQDGHRCSVNDEMITESKASEGSIDAGLEKC